MDRKTEKQVPNTRKRRLFGFLYTLFVGGFLTAVFLVGGRALARGSLGV